MIERTRVYDDNGLYEGIIDGRYVPNYKFEVAHSNTTVTTDTEDGPREDDYDSYAILQNRRVIASWVHKGTNSGRVTDYTIFGYDGGKMYDLLGDAARDILNSISDLSEYNREGLAVLDKFTGDLTYEEMTKFIGYHEKTLNGCTGSMIFPYVDEDMIIRSVFYADDIPRGIVVDASGNYCRKPTPEEIKYQEENPGYWPDTVQQ